MKPFLVDQSFNWFVDGWDCCSRMTEIGYEMNTVLGSLQAFHAVIAHAKKSRASQGPRILSFSHLTRKF